MLRLRELRKNKGYTQQYIADVLDMSRVNYTNIENGKRRLDSRRLAKLADLLEVSTDYLLGYGEFEYERSKSDNDAITKALEWLGITNPKNIAALKPLIETMIEDNDTKIHAIAQK